MDYYILWTPVGLKCPMKLRKRAVEKNVLIFSSVNTVGNSSTLVDKLKYKI